VFTDGGFVSNSEKKKKLKDLLRKLKVSVGDSERRLKILRGKKRPDEKQIEHWEEARKKEKEKIGKVKEELADLPNNG
jgi:hypothetical protein